MFSQTVEYALRAMVQLASQAPFTHGWEQHSEPKKQLCPADLHACISEAEIGREIRRLYPRLLYGSDHAYGGPLSGLGTAEQPAGDATGGGDGICKRRRSSTGIELMKGIPKIIETPSGFVRRRRRPTSSGYTPMPPAAAR
mgnify:CR=1 FL=1